MSKLRDLKVGDKVTRYLSSARLPMPMVVTEVTDTLIKCGDWTFDRNTGVEEDAELEWGVAFGATGSVIEAE